MRYPPFQQLPVRTELGRKLHEARREALGAKTFVSIDFAQLEAVLLKQLEAQATTPEQLFRGKRGTPR